VRSIFEEKLKEAIEDILQDENIYFNEYKMELAVNVIFKKLTYWLAKTSVSMCLKDIERIEEL